MTTTFRTSLAPMLASMVALLALAACGEIDERDPKPRLDAVSTPGGDFGATLLGTRKRLDFRLRNSDAGLARVKPLENVAPTLAGDGLSFSHTCPARLDEGEECFLSVYYEPAAAGTLAGELRVTSNAGAVARALGGSAVTALSPAAGVVAFSGGADGNFDSVARGSSKTLIYVVRNIGNADDAITVTAPSGSGWSASHDCPDTLAVGASCNLSVTFAPTLSGISVPTPLLVRDAYNGEYGGLALALTGTGR
ncbi:choice-of-anchor D domain-containing protein [Piscinibacter sp.]|uniref:choice-of-anchor D domain-containing protein n=1 Tax=Piscinibacter sp. TaxID=1903157 RepID=UPI0039E6AFA6